MNIPNIILNIIRKLNRQHNTPFKNNKDYSHLIIFSSTEDGNIIQREMDEKTKEKLKKLKRIDW